MILKQDEEIEIENLDDIESLTDSISAENTALVLSMLSTSFYSNPIGSIVRELASNCWDSHVEAGINKPIVIKITKDYENTGEYIITFTDEGVGLSEERFNKIYVNWGSSTKRATNNQKGGWGLGSKSPFSYTTEFYITTIYNGQERQYLANKSNGEFRFDKLYSIDTDKPNGTVIKLNIKNHDDRRKFASEIRQQLCYFSNVIATSDYDSFDNNYAIFELDHFKVRSNTPYYDMHILLGEAVYPIDWKQMNMQPIHVPIGIPFVIGSLPITPNREQIQYSADIVAIIKEKIELACKEAIDLFLKQNPVYEDLFDYIRHRDDNPLLTLRDSDRFVDLDLSVIGCPKKVEFGPLKEIGDLPKYIFSAFQVYKIKKGQVKGEPELFHPDKNLNPRNYYFTKYLNKYSNGIIGEGKVVVPTYFSNKQYLELLGLKARRGAPRDFYKKISTTYGCSQRPVLGTAKLILKYKRLVNEYVKNHFVKYPILTEEDIKRMKKEAAERAKAAKQLRKIQGTCFIYANLTTTRYEVKISELASYKKLFYFNVKDELDFNPNILFDWLNQVYKKEQCFQIIKVNDTNFRLIKHLPNLVSIENFFKTPELYPALNRTYYSQKWITFDREIRSIRFGLFSKYYEDKYSEFKKFITTYNNNECYKLMLYFEPEIKSIPVRKHKSILKYIDIKKELESIKDKFKATEYLEYFFPDKYKEQFKKAFLNGVKHLDYYGNNLNSKGIEYDPDSGRTDLQQESRESGNQGGNESDIQGDQGQVQQDEIDEIDQAIREKYGTGEEEGEGLRSLFESTGEEDQERIYDQIWL